jgi:hypothetical protein
MFFKVVKQAGILGITPLFQWKIVNEDQRRIGLKYLTSVDIREFLNFNIAIM